MRLDGVHPFGLGNFTCFTPCHSRLQKFRNYICNMNGLLIQHVWEIHRESRLRGGDNETVGKLASKESVKSLNTIGPLFRKRQSFSAVYLITRTA